MKSDIFQGMNRQRKTSIISFLGHIFEHFESSIFNFTGVFIASYFFTQGDDTFFSRYGIYLTISAYFWLAPIGATFFSWIGDRFGRRRAMLLAYFTIIMPAVVVPLIPSFESIGVASSILIMLCRFCQGLGTGGSFSGRIVFLGESSLPHMQNLNTGLLIAMGFLGALLGTTMASYCINLKDIAWGWKLPYIFGAILGISIFLLRHFILETDAWVSAEKEDKGIPFVSCVKKFPRGVIIVLLWGMALLMPFYLTISWFSGLVPDLLSVSKSFAIHLISITMFLSAVLIVLAAWLTKYIPLSRMLLWSVGTSVILGVSVVVVFQNPTLEGVLAIQWMTCLQVALSAVPVFIVSQKLFPPQYRFSGFSISFAVGQALMTGTTPIIAEYIYAQTGSLQATTGIIFLSASFLLLSWHLLRKAPLHKV